MRGFIKKSIGSGTSGNVASGTASLIISNEKMKEIMRIIMSFEDSSVLIKAFTEKNSHETKEQKGVFLGMLLDVLGVTLLGNMLPGKRVTGARNGVI